MMTTVEIYKNALENLRVLANRQQELAHRYPEKAPDWRAKFMVTKSKIQWLEKVLSLWEVR